MAHYFTNDENIKSEEQKTYAKINNQDFVFVTDNGVFSKKGLDFGTRTLLENIPQFHGLVLDFGCGYGPVGIYIKKNNDCVVDMIDINKRSVTLAKKNAILNEVDVNIFESDIYSNVDKKYDYIVSNPPIRIGKEKLYQILFDASKYLKEDGELWIVINKDQGAKSVVKDLSQKYEVNVVAKNKGFYIIKAINHWQVVYFLLKL